MKTLNQKVMCICLYFSPVRIVAVLPRSQSRRRRLVEFLHLYALNPLAAHALQMAEQIEPETSHDVKVTLKVAEEKQVKISNNKMERLSLLHRREEALGAEMHGRITSFATPWRCC